jgi:hypothetical protein
MQLNTRALFSLIPAVLIAPANFSAPVTPRADGYTITMRITTGTQAPMNITFKAAGEKMRLETDMSAMMGGGRGGAMATGAYMLPNSDGKLIMVMPNAPNMSGGTGMAMSMDLAQMAQRMGGAPPRVAEATVEDLGPGETILGYKTHKYRIRQPDGTVEAWIADLPGIDFKKFATGFGAQFSGMHPRMAEKIPSGFALKVVISGKETGTMEVSKIEKTSFTNSDFEVPAGLQVMDLGAMMGGRGRGGH